MTEVGADLKVDSAEKVDCAAGGPRPGPSGRRPKAIFLLNEDSHDLIYPAQIREQIEVLADVIAPPLSKDNWSEADVDLSEVEVIFSGWNMPVADQAFLDAFPKLQAVFYGAGTVRYFATPEFWARDILVTSSYVANSIPVAEYTLGAILLSLKEFWRYARLAKKQEGRGDHTRSMLGAYRTRVGIISFGMIARRVCELLKPFDVECVVACPFLTEAEAEEAGVTLASLEEVFSTCDVVSLHTPSLPETQGMLGGEHFERMKPNATFINTARGAVIREQEMVQVAKQRPDLNFILDVVEPEPPLPGSGILELENIIFTPHIAGSMGPEIGRLGEYMLDEFKCYLAGKPLKWQITEAAVARMA